MHHLEPSTISSVWPCSRVARSSARVAAGDSIAFDALLCDTSKHVSPNGTAIPMVLSMADDTCPNGGQSPQQDGYYQFNEEHYTVWFAYVKACGTAPPDQCAHRGAAAMWERWQGRRLHPNKFSPVGHYSLLSLWSGYLVQLPYYTTTFNQDAAYEALFRSHWLADWAYANSTLLAGERGRYGPITLVLSPPHGTPPSHPTTPCLSYRYGPTSPRSSSPHHTAPRPHTPRPPASPHTP
jgi:hypothetical protein